MKYYIYLIKNKINNKNYIGQTINYEKRIKEHLYLRKTKKNMIIDSAINKYGKENFYYNIIDIAYSQEQADNMEKKYIIEYNSLKPNGYNILKGGRNQKGSWNSKPILIYDLKGNFISEYESSLDLERKSNGKYKCRQIRLSCKKENHLYKDILVKFKEDNCKISKYIKPQSNRRKKVIQYDLEGNEINKFESIKEASEITKTIRTSIISCLKKKNKTANGFMWSYEEEKIDVDIIKPKTIIRTKIYQIDDDNNVINEFVSCKEAEKTLKLPHNAYKCIWKVLDSSNRKAYNFYWKRKV